MDKDGVVVYLRTDGKFLWSYNINNIVIEDKTNNHFEKVDINDQHIVCLSEDRIYYTTVIKKEFFNWRLDNWNQLEINKKPI
jgi:hypothetical protein